MRAKKKLQVFLVLLVAGLPLPLLASETPDEDSRFVIVREAHLRKTPSFLGEVLKTLVFKDEVKIVGGRAAWRQVRVTDGAEGWIHDTALTAVKIEWSLGEEEVEHGADSSEVALAARSLSESPEGNNREEGDEFAARSLSESPEGNNREEGDEVAVAARGLSGSLEDRNREEGDYEREYKLITRIEIEKGISPEKLAEFIRAGGLFVDSGETP